MRQPNWTVNEVIIAVDTYFEIGDVKDINSNNPLVIELSELLKALPIHKNKDNTFRNVASIEMNLKCIASLDENAKYSMRTTTILQGEVYNYYREKKMYLHKIANAIKACLPLPFDYYEPLDSHNLMMGNILYLYHLYLENKTKTSRTLTEDFYNRRKSNCACCGIDLSLFFGEKGFELIEQHYTEEIINYHNNMDILPGKFTALCPACHKLAHSSPDLFQLSNLKNIVKDRGKAYV